MSQVSTFSVKWVYSKPIANGHEGGQRPSLCFRGRKHALCVVTGHPVRVLKRPVELFDKYREVIVPIQGTVECGKGTVDAKRYSVAHAAEQMRDIGFRNGITEAASQLVDRALANRVDINEDTINDEEEIAMSTTEAAVKEEISKAKKVAKAAKKPEKKAKPAKKAKANGAKAPADKLGREGTLSRFINERLVKGQDNDTISAAAKKAFPKSKSTKPSHVSWFRWKLGELGVIKAKAKK